MRNCRVISLLVGLSLSAMASVTVSNNVGAEDATTDTPPCRIASLDDAKSMLDRAAKFLEDQGPKRAFTAFMEPGGEFVDRDLYVFVIHRRGTLVASGAYPEAVGSNTVGARDRRGRYFVREMMQVAAAVGEGAVEYEMRHPCTGDVSPKISFVRRVGPFVVGVGAYGTLGA